MIIESTYSGSGTQLHRLRLFNPSKLSDEDLEASFVAHNELFKRLINRIVDEKGGHVPQHHLIVGQRGMGKTTLLCRIAGELRKPRHSKSYIPLQFPEEQYIEIDRLSKFWLNCLDSLADALENEGDELAAQNLDLEIKSLKITEKNERELARKTQKLFTKIAQANERRLVLLLDNFQLLLERLKEEDYTLRAFFMREDAPILIGTSAIMPSDTNDYGAAFYDAFMIHILHRLSLQEMQNILQRLAENANNSELAVRIQNEAPRLAALRDLTGGNPRTTALLFELFLRGFSRDAYEDLEGLLDHMTPLYQSLLNQLSEQSQLVLGALARNWRPASALQLTKLTNLPRGSISTQLNRLEAVGLVEKVELSKGKKPGYQVAERFFNIWYLMRFTSRSQRNGLVFLTRFLQEFYTPVESKRETNDLTGESTPKKVEQTHTMALAESGFDTSATYELSPHTETLEVWEDAANLRRKKAPKVHLGEKIYSLEAVKFKLNERVVESGAKVDPDAFVDLAVGSIDLLPPFRPNRLDLIERKLDSNEVESLYALLLAKQKSSTSGTKWIEERIRRDEIVCWDDREKILQVLKFTDDLSVFIILGTISKKLADFELEAKIYEGALNIDTNADYLYQRLTFIYRDFMNDAAKAREYFTSASGLKTDKDYKALTALNEMLFASYEQNWGQVQKHLMNFINLNEKNSPSAANYNLIWSSAVLLHLGYGTKLVKFLDEEGWAVCLMPWVEALRAHMLGGKRHLLDIPQESRKVTGILYDQIELIRRHLPESTRSLFIK